MLSAGGKAPSSCSKETSFLIVMISACFCHLLAEALPETERAIPNFPLAPFLCALGYLLTLTADQFATRYSSHSHFHHHKPNPADLQMVVNAISKKGRSSKIHSFIEGVFQKEM